MFADDPADARGFRTVYTGPAHPYGAVSGRSPPWHRIFGNEDRRVLRLLQAIAKGKQPSPNFEDGLLTELVADAFIRSGESGVWEKVG